MARVTVRGSVFSAGGFSLSGRSWVNPLERRGWRVFGLPVLQVRIAAAWSQHSSPSQKLREPAPLITLALLPCPS